MNPSRAMAPRTVGETLAFDPFRNVVAGLAASRAWT